MEEEREEERRAWLAKQRAENERAKIKNMGVDAPYADGRFTLRTFWSGDTFSAQKTKERNVIMALERWAKQEEGKAGLFLYGDPGLGKSHLAQAALVEAWKGARAATEAAVKEKAPERTVFALRRKETARYVTFEDILKRVRATFDSEDGPRDSDVIDGYAKYTHWLAIDDLGASEKASDFTLRVMYEVINGRLRNRLPTILTANYDLSGLLTRIMPKGKDGKPAGDELEADRIIERIKELCDVARLQGESYRK